MHKLPNKRARFFQVVVNAFVVFLKLKIRGIVAKIIAAETRKASPLTPIEYPNEKSDAATVGEMVCARLPNDWARLNVPP